MSDKHEEERNKDFVKAHFVEFVNKKNAAVIFKNMTKTFYDHDGPDGEPTDAEGDKAMMEMMYRRFHDLHVTIEDIIAENDKVMCRNKWQWTDNSTGKKMEFHGFVLWRMEDGKIAERWATVTSPKEDK